MRPDVFVVIMAGGSGTRFWPLSRARRPKQLLPLGDSPLSLLRATFERFRSFAPPERVIVVTSAALADATARDLPELPPQNILAEPAARNTAACVAWAAAFARRRVPSALLVVVPADHYIGDLAGYGAAVTRAIDAASDGSLVTVGLKPSRPETGYGYVEVGAEVSPGVHETKRFVEKPDLARAKEFLTAGTFLWNSGMFFFRADAVLAEFRAQLPDIASAMDAFDAAASKGSEVAETARLYPGLTSISIDHGVMEHAKRVRVVPAEFGWSDVGSWITAWELAPKDPHDNAIRATEAITIDASGNYIAARDGKVVAVVGVSNLIVVDTEDALLILPRERSQDVRLIVDTLKKRGATKHL